MNYRIVRVVQLSGRTCNIYTVIRDDATISAFDEFLQTNGPLYQKQVRDIAIRLEGMGKQSGARDYFFKHAEGRLGDLVVVVKDEPEKILRLFCIRFGNSILVLGGGGPKKVRAWEDDPVLSKAAHELIKLSEAIKEAMKDKTLRWNEEGTDWIGDLTIELDDEQT